MTHSVSRERTREQPGLVQGQCQPGLGGVLLILPAGTSSLLQRPVVGRLWIPTGAQEGHMGDSIGDRRCSEWAGQASLRVASGWL